MQAQEALARTQQFNQWEGGRISEPRALRTWLSGISAFHLCFLLSPNIKPSRKTDRRPLYSTDNEADLQWQGHSQSSRLISEVAPSTMFPGFPSAVGFFDPTPQCDIYPNVAFLALTIFI